MDNTNKVNNSKRYSKVNKSDFDLALFVSILIAIMPLISHSIVPAIMRQGDNSGFHISKTNFLSIFFGVVSFSISYLIMYLKKDSKKKISETIFSLIFLAHLGLSFYYSIIFIWIFADYTSLF